MVKKSRSKLKKAAPKAGGKPLSTAPRPAPKAASSVPRLERRSVLRKHLDGRLRALHQRAMLIEAQLQKLDDNRFYRVCIFGSARTRPDTQAYNDVVTLARMLSWEGIDILTGGGPGLMEAANKGAKLGQQEKHTKSLSIGISIQLDTEVKPNKHLDINRHHYRFSSRLDDFMRLSHAMIVTPGGIGTILELFFSWQLVQRHHLSKRPIVLLGRKFWQGLLEWVRNNPLAAGMMDPPDFDFIHLADSPEEVCRVISKDHLDFRNNSLKRERKNG